jgi:hypothetical protein
MIVGPDLHSARKVKQGKTGNFAGKRLSSQRLKSSLVQGTWRELSSGFSGAGEFCFRPFLTYLVLTYRPWDQLPTEPVFDWSVEGCDAAIPPFPPWRTRPLPAGLRLRQSNTCRPTPNIHWPSSRLAKPHSSRFNGSATLHRSAILLRRPTLEGSPFLHGSPTAPPHPT